ncbi:MAG TPA: neocarzinostatin apoprotein domain-containing protein [Iamia sp.]|jgi:hypothetical protein|nr:neocarzinostatin apoprotein domain-containing protein [Iamia sp.]
MRSTGPGRIVAVTALLLGLVGGVAGLNAAPAGATGLVLKATTPTTNLQPGAKVTVKITGAGARQVVRYGVCADTVPCAPAGSVTANASGVATVSLTLTGTATYVSGGKTGVKACRPDRCFVAAHPQGQVSALKRLPLGFLGERVTASISGTNNLVDGQTVFVTGRVRGAEGRTVRAIQTKPACGPTCVVTVGQGTVASNGTFSFTGQVRRTLAAGTAGSCSPAANPDVLGPCQIEVSVVGDPSHGIASTLIRFVAPGVTATVTPRSDLVDRQVVRVTGSQPALAGRMVRLRQWACDVTDPFNPVCSFGPTMATTLDAQGRLNATLAVRRMIGAEDCARNRYPSPDCYIEVMVLNNLQNPDTRYEVTKTLIFFRPV